MTSRKEGIEKITAGAGFVLIGIIISKVIGYFYRIIVARTGPEPYGLLSLGLAILGIVLTFSLLWLDNGVLRYVSYYQSKKDTAGVKATIFSAFKIALPISIFLSFITFLIAGKISTVFFHNPELEPIIKIIAISIPFDVLAIILFQVHRAFQIVKYEIGIKYITENIIKIILVSLFLSLGITLLGPVLAYSISIIITGTWIFWVTKKKVFNFADKNIKYQPIYKELFLFSWPLLLTQFLMMILAWIDTIMLGYFKNASEVGIYNAAIPTAQMLYVIPFAFSYLFVPVLTDLFAKEEWSSFNSLYRTTTKWIFMINIIPLTIFIFFSKEVVQTLFGVNYAASATPLLILSIGYFVNYFTINSSNTIIVYKKTKMIFVDLMIGTLLNIVLNYFLIPIYGGKGAAISTAISFSVVGILYFIQAKRLVRIKIIDISYLKMIFAAACSLILVFILRKLIIFDRLILNLMISAVIFFAVYCIFLVMLKVFDKEDSEILNSIKVKIKEFRS